ncbi:hypothetical protein LOTGIDRAFT_155010 [Lottia gigantea]|uniref:DNA-directed DNA polymerase n=1 Tax=Lottia gigantea TaxID=225164 RepID=V3Z4C7_LOTGI|nr:hypothetical protein LOTGIDRAFT_155010 [Lottia gigantea]ESO85523.1 hypothetical protein LOTGIDRAFT_155010 [Lottia gigantea]
MNDDDDDALTCFAQLKLNVISQPHDDTLFGWDCETYSENKAIPYCCTLFNLEKLRKKLELIERVFPDLKPTDPIPEEYYNKLMTNIVEIFVGTDCFDQMLRRLGTVDQKRLTLIARNASGFDNWIALQSINKLTQCPLKKFEQKFRPRNAILKVCFEYPKNMFFQPIPAKDKKELRNKYKKEGDVVASNCMKLLGNSLYGKSIQRDRNTLLHLWNEETFRLNYDKHVKKYDKLNETQYIVEINDEEKEFIPPKDSTRLTPTHLGKNDYGDGGIIFGLYLAPKVKYNIILTSDGVLKEKKTFKGYSNYKIKVEDYIQLASGHDVTHEFDKPGVKSFTDGIFIPNEKQTKKFRSYLNLIKRKAPDDEGIMYPYSDTEEMCLDENYEFDDFDYFTNVSNDDPSE